MSLPFLASAGTWSDSFSESTLGQEWHGDTNFFSIVNGTLKGVSASPLAPVPLRVIEVGTDWTDYVVQCRMNVVTPNLLVCTKGALILRHRANEGYVFALHVATKTIEVYRFSDGQILLSKDAPLELKRWYRIRAELQGNTISFFVDDQWIGTIIDARSTSGAVGLAVQDALEVQFDDFSVTGPNIPGNGLEASRFGDRITLAWPNGLKNYVLEASENLSSSGNWRTITNTPIAASDRFSVTLDIGAGSQFYRLAPSGE